jgi:uncharacterized protein
MTEACNMACTYCSAEKDFTRVPRLTEALGRQIIDALAEFGLSSYSVCFHGGEPLLGYKAIQATVEHARSEHPEIGFNFSMQSNLSLMTSEKAAWFSANHVSVGFSIDGRPPVNDRFRVFHKGGGTSAATLQGLKILQAHQPRVGCVAVIGGHNWSQMRSFIEFLGENGVHRIALNRLAPVGKALAMGDAGHITDEQYVACLKEAYFTMVESGFHVQVKPIVDWARKIVSPTSCSHGCYQCGAGWSHISIDSTGKVYACDRFSFDPDWVSGSILDSTLLEIFNESKMYSCRTRTERIPECGSCSVVNVCGGSCAVTSYYAKGTIDTPGHECGNMRQFIPWLEHRMETHDDERTAIEAMQLGYDPQDVFELMQLEMH